MLLLVSWYKTNPVVPNMRPSFLSSGKISSLVLDHDERLRLQQIFGVTETDATEKRAADLFREEDSIHVDGRLDLEEFSVALGVLGSSNIALANMMFQAVDEDRDGYISFTEFVHWMLTMTSDSPEHKLRLGFSLCCEGSDRVAALEEFYRVHRDGKKAKQSGS